MLLRECPQVRQRLGVERNTLSRGLGPLRMAAITRQALEPHAVHLPHQFLAALGKVLPGGLARVDDDQFSVLRAGVGADEYLAELYQFA